VNCLYALRHRIKMSIMAVVFMFAMGATILGSSMLWFDFRLHIQEPPKSMLDNPLPQRNDNMVWLAVMLGAACASLPLGFYVMKTLHECHELTQRDFIKNAEKNR
jgi:hypothetical protein